MARVYIGVGSNQDRERHVRAAIAALASQFGALALSPVYESPAWGFEGEPFFNLVIGFDTDLLLEDLLKRLRDIEMCEGRVRNHLRFGPRTLDLDVLLFDARIVRQGSIRIPREEILTHAFVLKPLADLLPMGVHPESGQTYAHHWDAFCTQHPKEARALTRLSLTLTDNP